MKYPLFMITSRFLPFYYLKPDLEEALFMFELLRKEGPLNIDTYLFSLSHYMYHKYLEIKYQHEASLNKCKEFIDSLYSRLEKEITRELEQKNVIKENNPAKELTAVGLDYGRLLCLNDHYTYLIMKRESRELIEDTQEELIGSIIDLNIIITRLEENELYEYYKDFFDFMTLYLDKNFYDKYMDKLDAFLERVGNKLKIISRIV